MNRYDFSAASDFLAEAQLTPEELYEEIQTALSDIHSLRNKSNKNKVLKIWHTLLTVADFLERIG
ncbi:MAG: hypothetical protein HDS16_05210 [Bacteroides sp.]|nr:hypothetical protein [Bacteroides sp.]